jgi:hypothetical protein
MIRLATWVLGTALLAEVALGAVVPYPFGWRAAALGATVGSVLNCDGMAGFALVVAAALLAVSSAG